MGLLNPRQIITNTVGVTHHNHIPVGGFSANDTGKGGNCGG
jgi:hypothetical protein